VLRWVSVSWSLGKLVRAQRKIAFRQPLKLPMHSTINPEIITSLWAMDFFGWEAGVFGQLHPRLKVHHRVLDPHGTPCNVVRLHKRLRRGMCTIIHDPMPKKAKICNIICIYIYTYIYTYIYMYTYIYIFLYIYIYNSGEHAGDGAQYVQIVRSAG